MRVTVRGWVVILTTAFLIGYLTAPWGWQDIPGVRR